MAAPGFGYVKRDVEKTTIDWSAVSGDLTKSLGGALAAGEKQKADVAITDQTMAGEIQKLPKGVTPDQSKYYASAIQNIGDANQEIKEQYDNGEITATQYKIAVNSLNTQYQIFKNNATSYQKSYDDFIKKVTDGKSGATTQLVATWVDQMGGMNKSVGWNKDSQTLESSYVANGEVIKSPVANDLSLMNYYNTAFDNKLITEGSKRFGEMISSTEDIEGNLKYIKGYRKNAEFQESLTGYARASVASDRTGVDAAEYLAAEKGYKLVSGTPQNEKEIQVLNNKNGIPEVVDIEKYKKLAIDGFKEDILVTLDSTYKTQEGSKNKSGKKDNAFYEMTYLPNIKAVEDFELQFETIKRNNPGIPLSVQTGIASKPIVKRLKELSNANITVLSSEDYDNLLDKNKELSRQLMAEEITQEQFKEQFVKSPKGIVFYLKKPGKDPVPYTIKNKDQILNIMNEISGINPQKRADFAKKYLQSQGQTKKTVNYSNK